MTQVTQWRQDVDTDLFLEVVLTGAQLADDIVKRSH